VDLNAGLSVYGNSHGFLQAEHKTRHGISCAVVAESNGKMQRDYWYDVSRHPDRLASARSIGEKAAERTLRRLDAHKLKTQQAPVLFAAELARGIISSFTSAIGGAAQYRKASFLLDAVGEQVFPDFMQMREQPFLPQALASANFDGEGVATNDASLVVDGVIQSYLLDTYSARKLGLRSTGHASGIHNLSVESTGKSFDECLTDMHRGFLVTELMGHGVNTVTGDYSRGAAGFWVENGKLDHAVEEVTIAANLRDMFKGIVDIGNDVDYRGGIHCGSILIDNMTIAGAD
jgi:PmbA protein